MLLTLAISLFVLSVVFHELGHFVAMRRCGVYVTEMGLGMPIGPGLSFTVGKDTPHPLKFSLYPLLLGAFVRNDPKCDIEALPAGDRAFIYAAGPMANIIFTTVMLYILFAMNMDMSSVRFGPTMYPILGLLAGGTVFSLAFILFPRQISLYVCPVISLLLVWWFATLLANITPEQFVRSSGMVVVVQVAKVFSVTPSSVVYFAGLISFALGAMNLLPIYLLDGGHLVGIYVAKLGERVLGVYKRFGSALIILLMIIAVGEDIRKLFFT